MSDRRARLALASGIAMVCAIYTWIQHDYFIVHGSAPDSLYLWRAAQLMTHGLDPWSAAVWNNATTAFTGAHDAGWTVRLVDPLYYPMPAVLLWVPLSMLPFLAATTLFNSIGAFLFVYAVTRDGLHRAWLCGSMPFVFAMRFGQWSPLIAAAVVLPALAAVLVAKPNLGLPVFVSAPSITAAIACALLLVLPTLIAPWWVREWIANVSGALGRSAPHPAPVTMFGGA
ncbi:MAG: hypothetical protein H7099_12455, partial [Gemmatimonadaceae bacterium]|nr:hypothetical protein [Gemmatimonadaceae bacterium]